MTGSTRVNEGAGRYADPDRVASWVKDEFPGCHGPVVGEAPVPPVGTPWMLSRDGRVYGRGVVDRDENGNSLVLFIGQDVHAEDRLTIGEHPAWDFIVGVWTWGPGATLKFVWERPVPVHLTFRREIA